MARRLVAVLLAVALPVAVHPAPAVVKVFEAKARAEPSSGAAVVQAWPEGAQVSVSEEVTNGWRRVRLADGTAAWIEDAAVRLVGEGEPPPRPPAVAAPVAPAPSPPPALLPPPPGAPPPPPDLRARIYVKDLDHLASLMKEDPIAGPASARLVQRRRAAWTVGGIGLVTSVVLFSVAASKFGCHSDLGDPDFGRSCGEERYMVAGASALLVSGVVAVAVHPKGSDLLDVINGWNERHPERPFSLFGHGALSR